TEGIPYGGFIFFGLMNVSGESYVFEYIVGMVYSETGAVVAWIKSDLAELLYAAADGTLKEKTLEVRDEYAATVVLVSAGYPGAYKKGKQISGIENVKEALVFHAGTAAEGEAVLTNGGRVIAVTGMGASMNKAMEQAYKGVDNIVWEGKNFRKDIGQDLMARV